MDPETRQLVWVLVALASWIGFIIAIVWSSVHDAVLRRRQRRGMEPAGLVRRQADAGGDTALRRR